MLELYQFVGKKVLAAILITYLRRMVYDLFSFYTWHDYRLCTLVGASCFLIILIVELFKATLLKCYNVYTLLLSLSEIVSTRISNHVFLFRFYLVTYPGGMGGVI